MAGISRSVEHEPSVWKSRAAAGRPATDSRGPVARADPAGALWSVLRDPDTREQLAEARAGYLSELAMGVDGRATERILALVRDMAAGDRPGTARR